MQAPFPLVHDLVLIGGGHAHALVLRMWAMDPMPGVRVTLINPGPAAPYTGMLPGLIAGHYARPEIFIDLIRLARAAGARVILGRATGLDLAAGTVLLEGRPPLPFDTASVDVGIGSGLPGLPGFEAHSVAAKPLGAYAEAWEAFVNSAPQDPSLVVVGGGVGGVELALAQAHRLRKAGRSPQVTVLEQGPMALPHLGSGARARLLAELAAQGIEMRLNARPVQAEAGAMVLQDGTRLPSDFTLTVAGGRPQGWIAETGLALQDGFLRVDKHLQTSDPRIFAAGDCAYLSHAPRPKAGVYAVRAAPVLHANLHATISGGRLRPFHPQRDYLKLISLGDRQALADKFGLRAGGKWLWAWKDRIDRRFMALFEDLPAMAAAPPQGAMPPALRQSLTEAPLCGGCGAKVGAGALGAALSTLPAPRAAGVLSGPGDDAAQLAGPGGQVQVLTTDHLRAVTGDERLMTRIAAVHALGDVWAMGARPQAALVHLILPRASEALQARMLAEVMDEAAAVMAAAGADVVGGHTSLGAELTVGFTVTGLTQKPLTKAGARPGDVLILTKPLGTGILLAAEMAGTRLPGAILGEAVAEAMTSICAPLGPAAAVLAPVAHAMTDVTGFGLAGHLLEICAASGVAAELDLAALPLLSGALALSGLGVASSLAPANRAAVLGRLAGDVTAPEVALVFDPQTGGGLLAAVPADRAAAVLAALGPGARAVGRVVAGAPRLTLIGGQPV